MGTILELKTGDGTALLPSPQLKRLVENLHDLIIAACERSTNRPGKSLSLKRCTLVFSENNVAKSFMLFDVLVRDQEAGELIPLRVAIGAYDGDEECYQP